MDIIIGVKMNEGLKKAYFRRIAESCLQIVKDWCPIDTGKMNSEIYLEWREDGFTIVIPTEYTVYTNEVWISPKWKGKSNPNEGWINIAFDEIRRYLNEKFSHIDLEMSFEDVMNEQGDVVTDYIMKTYGGE